VLVTIPAHDPAPSQATEAVCPATVTSPAHAFTPTQSIPHVLVAVQLTLPLHASDPTAPQFTWQLSPPHDTDFAHAPGLTQSMKQLAVALHTTSPAQAPAPEAPQATTQSEPPHVTVSPQESGPTHSMSHELAAEQSIGFEHDPLSHVTMHGMLGGQVIGALHEWTAVQSNEQVPPSTHVPPASGHSCAQRSPAAVSVATSAPVAASPAASTIAPPPSSVPASVSPAASNPDRPSPQALADRATPPATTLHLRRLTVPDYTSRFSKTSSSQSFCKLSRSTKPFRT
jgi:hypothetical protein